VNRGFTRTYAQMSLVEILIRLTFFYWTTSLVDIETSCSRFH